MLYKIKNYILRAYIYGHFPTFRQLFISKQNVLAYYGFLGDRNFGDELVFESANALFKDATLLPILRQSPLYVKLYKLFFNQKIKGIIVGGGTLINPYFTEKEFIQKLISQNIPIFFHGTGVATTIHFEKTWDCMLSSNSLGGVRGQLSCKRVLEAVGKHKTILGDACFCLYEPMIPSKTFKNVLINFGTHHEFEGEENARTALIHFTKELIRRGYNVCFLPLHQIDEKAAISIKNEVPELKILEVPTKFWEAKAVFLNYSFAVGLRLHFIAMAVLCRIPFVSINYKDKHEDLLGSLGLEDAGVLPINVNKEKLLNSFDSMNSFDWKTTSKHLSSLKIIQQSEASKLMGIIQK